MMKNYRIKVFPGSRIATNDVCAIGMKKHHIAAFLEVDVSDSRKKVRERRKQRGEISFFAWLIKAISLSIRDYSEVAAYLVNKRSIAVFNDINVSVAVEKSIDGSRVPIPLVIEKADSRSIEEITRQIREARDQVLTPRDIVLRKKSGRMEHLYYALPGFLRRAFWKYLIHHPSLAYEKMGNVAITSVGGLSGVNAWFVPISVHPVCIGIGDIVKKPVVAGDQIVIREMLNLTVLMDHDVVDGMEMKKFIKRLAENISAGMDLN